jgi:hypothetical protein
MSRVTDFIETQLHRYSAGEPLQKIVDLTAGC